MQNKVCCCFGHRDCYGLDLGVLRGVVERLIVNDGVNIFLNGNRGEFDCYFGMTVAVMQEKYPHVRHMLIEPYPTRDLAINRESYERVYDKIIIPREASTAERRAAIPIRNRWMVDHSDIIVAYVQHTYGGAYKAVQYAKERKKQVIYLPSESI